MNTKLLAKRTLVQTSTATLVILLAWMLVSNNKIIITVFGGILLAVLFYGSAKWLEKKTNLSVKLWLPITVLAPFLALGSFFWYTAPQVAAQASELMDRLPRALSYMQEQLTGLEWAGQFSDNFENLSQYTPQVSTILNTVSGVFSSAMDGIGSFIFALVIGLFLCVNPKWYFNGLVALIPSAHRERAREVLNTTGTSLSGWLVAKITSMVVVGILSTLGLWALGIDLALILGIIAALLSFIPNLGPIIAFIPAAMVSMISGLDSLLYVTLLYVAIQTIESYVITPALQAELVDLPPALTLFAQVMLASMVGITGILLAAPLTVTLMIIVKMWYIEDLLGDKETRESS